LTYFNPLNFGCGFARVGKPLIQQDSRRGHAAVNQSIMRIKCFQPWKGRRPFQWSDYKSADDVFGGSDAPDGIDEAIDFFVSSVTSATGANHTCLRVAQPFHDTGGIEVPIRSENPITHQPASHVS
jgi:hypothetical protein